MKAVKYLLIVLAGLGLFVACQKEMSTESGFAGQSAKGSLLDSTGNCKNIAINGVYIVDSTLGVDNYVTVQLNIASGGSYKILSDTQNGFSFLDSGVVAAGVQTVRLKATGRPIQAKQTTFSVAFDTTFCNFTITVVSKTPATYALVTSGSSCSTPNIQGTYTTGVALNSANKVSLPVNVTAPGSYAVTTSTVGGMIFSGTGTFTAVGAQTITLQGSGTPTTVGPNTIPVTAGSSNCSFAINVVAGSNNSSINDADSAWQFNQGTAFFHGPFYDVFDTTINNTYGFVFLGFTPTSGDTVIQFGTFSTTAAITPGTTFNSKDSYAAFYYTDFRRHDSTGDKIYSADYSNRTTANTAITISSFNTTTRVVTGTFTGTATNAAGTAVPITNGKFTAKVRKT